MSLDYKAVAWNPAKRRYDGYLALGSLAYLASFLLVSIRLDPEATAETLLIRSFGSLAFLLLHVILAIGPLARLDARFLPLLYNRRHLGVTMFLCALVHAALSLVQFHALGDVNPLLSLFSSHGGWRYLPAVPFQMFGFFALLILFAMAATSHDFWLKQLTAPVWKALHMLVYLAYALLLAHVSFGALTVAQQPAAAVVLALGLLALLVLHGLAARKERRIDQLDPPGVAWQDVCHVNEIRESRACMATVAGERVAIFRYDGKLSAVSNVCQHQNGPLGEGKIVDGCIVCPWHGYQYLPESGASPAPFEEKIPTFRIMVADGRVLVDPRPLPPGTWVEPARIGNPQGENQGELCP